MRVYAAAIQGVYDFGGDGEDILCGISDRLDGEPIGAVFRGGGTVLAVRADDQAVRG